MNYIALHITESAEDSENWRAGQVIAAKCLGIRELVSSKGNVHLFVQANGETSRLDGKLICTEYGFISNATEYDRPIKHKVYLKYFRTSKPVALTREQVKKEKDKASRKRILELKQSVKSLFNMFQCIGEHVAALDNYKAGEFIAGKDFANLLRYHGIKVPLRTLGYIQSNLSKIKVSGTKVNTWCKNNYRGNKIYKLAYELQEAVQA